jgi:CelD/BcsL family acetyltransferase involved in cellulose biosynthesis
MSSSRPPSVDSEPIAQYDTRWLKADDPLGWHCLFSSPPWLQAWWQVFGNGTGLSVLTIRQADGIVGIAPLVLEEDTACFIGGPDVCDYLDFAIAEGKESVFFEALFYHLRKQGVAYLDLGPLHPESTVIKRLAPLSGHLDCIVSLEPDESVFEMPLPPTWDDFLNQLTGKQRHEIRRKLRRLEDAGEIRYRVIRDVDEVGDAMDVFLTLFRSNRSDKSAFMTDQMVTYFQTLAAALARKGILRLFFLDMDGLPAAAAMCFDYQSTRYLYNNGYDSLHRSLSLGLLSKVFTIRDSIREGKRRYSFLKGDEAYKKHLGGNEVKLYRCRVEL